jgi:hypothetical protein
MYLAVLQDVLNPGGREPDCWIDYPRIVPREQVSFENELGDQTNTSFTTSPPISVRRWFLMWEGSVLNAQTYLVDPGPVT